MQHGRVDTGDDTHVVRTAAAGSWKQSNMHVTGTVIIRANTAGVLLNTMIIQDKVGTLSRTCTTRIETQMYYTTIEGKFTTNEHNLAVIPG